METFARIVLPIDSSAASERGIAYAATLAKAECAAVDVCAAIDETSIILPIAEGAMIDPAPLLMELEVETKRVLDAAVTQLRAAGVSADATILRGRPVVEVDAFARRVGADAIVLGTSGRGGLERAFLGSVTTALLCAADIPVITVHVDDEEHTGPLLVAIDASIASTAALRCAIGRAQVTGATLLLLHVFEEHRVEWLSATLGLRAQTARRRALTDAENALEESADLVRNAGVAFRTAIEPGAAAETILAASRTHDVRSIAIGTHGRGALERLMLGSVADRVVREAHVPVLVVRRRARQHARVFRSSLEGAATARA